MSRDVAILVVDDARFPVAVIARTLEKAGFRDVRFAETAARALAAIERRPVDVLVADWALPDMNGLTLTRRVREIDRARHRYTVVVLLAGEDHRHDLSDALDAGVDDFVDKAELRTALLPRVMVAARAAVRHKRLLERYQRLERRLKQIEGSLLIDPLTGLGNQRMTINAMGDTLRQVESRGGAACLVMVGIVNLEEIHQRYDDATTAEVLRGFAHRLRHLVRPLDVVTHPRTSTFGVVTHQPDIDNCSASSFRRIFDNLNQRSFQTERGFVPVRVGMSIIACDNETGLPDAVDMIRAGLDLLQQAIDTGVIAVKRWRG